MIFLYKNADNISEILNKLLLNSENKYLYIKNNLKTLLF